MSNKPPKKSDLSKKWMKDRSDRKILMNPEYHLIVCEGEKTEPKYFEEIKKIINSKYKDKINLQIQGEGMSTLKLLEKAMHYVEANANTIKHVWLVYDKDDFPKKDFNLTDERCRQLCTDDIKYHALWSNQCVELWFLLHFIYFDSNIHRTDYFDKLSFHLEGLEQGKYVKNREDVYFILHPKLKFAIENAKRLETKYYSYNPSNMSPATMIYKFFEKMEPYL